MCVLERQEIRTNAEPLPTAALPGRIARWASKPCPTRRQSDAASEGRNLTRQGGSGERTAPTRNRSFSDLNRQGGLGDASVEANQEHG